MLTAVKNQLKITILSIKYGIMREMVNKASFIVNIVFMILNDAAFIVQWVVLYSLKNEVGGYTLKQVFLLWGLAAGTFGFSRFFFKKAFSLSDTITLGKLDSYIVQPKNILLSAITSDVDPSALGDIVYSFIMLFASGITISKLILYPLCIITGGIIVVAIAIILASLSFWINKSDMVADTGNNLMINFATYPDGIFKGISKFILFTIIPVGFVNYIPVWVLTQFDLKLTLGILLFTAFTVILAFVIFYKGLKKYSSSNLMAAKI